MDTRVYSGITRDDGRRYVMRRDASGQTSLLPRQSEIHHHSEDHNWGCMSPGTLQLALDLAAEIVGHVEAAMVYRLLADELAKICLSDWRLTAAHLRQIIDEISVEIRTRQEAERADCDRFDMATL